MAGSTSAATSLFFVAVGLVCILVFYFEEYQGAKAHLDAITQDTCTITSVHVNSTECTVKMGCTCNSSCPYANITNRTCDAMMLPNATLRNGTFGCCDTSSPKCCVDGQSTCSGWEYTNCTNSTGPNLTITAKPLGFTYSLVRDLRDFNDSMWHRLSNSSNHTNHTCTNHTTCAMFMQHNTSKCCNTTCNMTADKTCNIRWGVAYTYTFTVSVHSHPNASSGIPPSVKQCGCDEWACVNRTSSSFGQMGANVTCWYDDSDHSVAFSRPSRSKLIVGEIGMGFGVCFLAIGAMFAFLWLGNQASKRKQSAYQPIGGAIGNVNTASQYPQHSPRYE